MSIVLDLDALAPRPGEMVLGGEKIKFAPPSTRQLMKLAVLFINFGKAEGEEEVFEAIEAIEKGFEEVVPDLKDKTISMTQYRAILDKMNEASVPPDIAELQKNGIEPVGDTEKKDDSATEKS